MRRRKQQPVEPAIDRSHFVEDNIRAGEIVGIRGERGTYKITGEVLNTKSGAEWVELFGGSFGHKEFRAVRPERIVKRRQPRE